MAYVPARRPTIRFRGFSAYRGMGACINPDAQGIGKDDTTGETCFIQPGQTVVNVSAGSSPTFTQWLNSHENSVLIGSAAFLALMLFARAGR